MNQVKVTTTVDMWTIKDIEFIGEDQNLTWFCINTLENATGNFDAANKLGEGGFGPVYKVFKLSLLLLFCGSSNTS